MRARSTGVGGGADDVGSGAVAAEVDVRAYRGWVALDEEYRDGDGLHYSRAWYVDVDPASTVARWSGDYYYRFKASECQKSEVAGRGDGAADLQIDRYVATAQDAHGLAVGTEYLGFAAVGAQGEMIAPGVEWLCNDLEKPQPIELRETPPNALRAAVPWPRATEPPVSVSRAYSWTDSRGHLLGAVVCMSRETLDRDADGVPDAVGGPVIPLTRIDPVFGGPHGLRDLPRCLLGGGAPPTPQCADSSDNDFDGLIDLLDPGCASATDSSELGQDVCDNGTDDDGDGLADFAGLDRGCSAPADNDERAEVTVIVQGPGIVALPDAQHCIDRCTFAADGLEVQVVAMTFGGLGSAQPQQPMRTLERIDAFIRMTDCPAAIRANAAGVLVNCTFTTTADVTIEAQYDPVVAYAPRVLFEPGERHWPTSPSGFVAHSRLRWASQGDDSRLCKATNDKTDRTFRGRPAAAALAAGAFSHEFCWSARKNGGAPWERKRFDTNDLTAPSEDKRKAQAPWARWGFYLDLDNAYQRGDTPPNQSYGEYPNAPQVPYEFEHGKYVTYWFFSAKNHVSIARVNDYHEGDWEHIAVRLDTHNRATHIAYWQHYCQPSIKYRSLLLWADLQPELVEGTHPPVYVAKGAHASYPFPGETGLPCGDVQKGMLDSHQGSGVQWRTWQRGVSGFENAKMAPWYGYAGGWGSKTKQGAKRWPGPFSGPLGPGRTSRRRIRARPGVVPYADVQRRPPHAHPAAHLARPARALRLRRLRAAGARARGCAARMLIDDGSLPRDRRQLLGPGRRLAECDRARRRRAGALDRAGDVQLLGQAEHTRSTSRACSTITSPASCASHPTRFVGLGTLPLQAPDLAIARARALRARTRPAGRADRHARQRHEPRRRRRCSRFFEAAQRPRRRRLRAPVGHARRRAACRSTGCRGWSACRRRRALAICSLIFGGVLERLPRLRIALRARRRRVPRHASAASSTASTCRPDLCAVDTTSRRATTSPATTGRRASTSTRWSTTPTRCAYADRLIGADRIALGTRLPVPARRGRARRADRVAGARRRRPSGSCSAARRSSSSGLRRVPGVARDARASPS